MALSLKDLQAAFKKPDQTEGNFRPNNYYPFWNIADGQQAIVRFLPDKNTDNPFGFVVEKLMHTLVINGENKSIACPKMHNEDCPVCKVSSEFYKKEDKESGKKYWRKKQHIAQAIVVEDPLKADEATGETHEGKVRFLALGFQLFQVIQAAFESGDLDENPTDLDSGYDFVIKKSKQGEYSTYAVGSRFKAKPRSLTEEERTTADEQMIDLATLLPASPGEEKIAHMLTSALTGAAYAEDSKSSKSNHPTPASGVSDSEPAPKSTAKATPAPKAQEPEGDDSEADEILASIRNRRSTKV